MKLPEDLKRLYLENNGQREFDSLGGSMLGLKFLSLQQISVQWKRDVLPGLEWSASASKPEDFRTVPQGAVQQVYFHRKWLPLFTDGQGDYLGLDFAPGPNGKMGQVINFGTREFEHCQIAEDMTSFLGLINEKLKKHAKDVVIVDNEGRKLVFGVVGEGHLTDDLRLWTRERYGLPTDRL